MAWASLCALLIVWTLMIVVAILVKVRLNLYYLQHYSFWMDLKMIFATVLGRKIEFAGEEI